jgi:hypothetical protein
MATKQSIVKAEAQLIPQVNPESLALALSELADELACIPEWKSKAEAWLVDSPAAYKAIGEFRATVRSQRKIPKFKLEPFQEVVDRARDFLKNKRKEAEDQFDAIDRTCTEKMDAQATRERMAAEAEERRINNEKRIREEKEAAERRKAQENQAEIERKQREREIAEAKKAGELKAAEAKKLQKEAEEKAARDREAAQREEQSAKENFKPVEVKPNLPTITGSRRHRNYYADYTDFDALLQAYVDTYKPYLSSQHEAMLARRAFLRQFIMENQQTLGKIARETQDSKKLMDMIPGIKARDRDKT